MEYKKDLKIVKLSEIDNNIKVYSMRVFVEIFYELYRSLSKDKSILQDFFLATFDHHLTYAAIDGTRVVGFLAIATAKERSMKFNKNIYIKFFGKVMGTIIYYQLMPILGYPNLDNTQDIGIDYLATLPSARGKGVATILIDYTCTNLCDDVCYIDVSATNTTAKTLYEHVGFIEYDQEYSLTTRLKGFKYISRMKKVLNTT